MVPRLSSVIAEISRCTLTFEVVLSINWSIVMIGY